MEKDSVLPLLFGAGLAAAVMSGTKKKKKKKPKLGDACDVDKPPPKGFACEGGVLEAASTEEDDLELDEDPSGEEAGDFEEREEDMSPGEDEVYDEDGDLVEDDPMPVSASCDDFLKAVHVATTDPSEYPIHSVAVTQTVIPVMDQALSDYASSHPKPIDVDEVGPLMVLESLAALVPVCTWDYDEVADEFTFDNGKEIDSKEGGEVLFGLMKLATEIVEKFNQGFNLTATLDPNPNVTASESESPFQAQTQPTESPFQATPSQGN